MNRDLPIDEHVSIPAQDLEWRAVRSAGPGGQNVNKVSTKVELRFDLAGTRALRPDVKQRLRALAGHRLDAVGVLIITSQTTRSQSQNLEDARDKLASMIAKALVKPVPRRATKPTRSSKRRRLDDKRRQGARKDMRRSVRNDD